MNIYHNSPNTVPLAVPSAVKSDRKERLVDMGVSFKAMPFPTYTYRVNWINCHGVTNWRVFNDRSLAVSFIEAMEAKGNVIDFEIERRREFKVAKN